MSATVDSRVVEMRFDNSHFERNVSTTMSTLDKLKMKLNLSDSHKGLENVGKAAKNVDMTGLANGVENVRNRFSALEVMGVTALANITNSAVNAGKRIVKSLTIDPIMTGFQEYETKMGSIQTILSNTQHAGTTMDDVISALNELNLYADKTIYNFQQMTKNVGTFTAAGLDLDTSVRSIQGIANLAAVSGSTSQQASTAMYQLSQALATGTVRLMDWNSVVNAGMGGKVFQDALIRTAAVINGASDDVDAWKKKNIDAFGSFRDSLTQGGWLTTEVLSKTLEQFTMAAEEGTEEWNKFKEALKSEGYTEEQAEAILKMGTNAEAAATKVKTYTQLMETLKESAQSGWAQTWEMIVGDFEEAKEFFGQLSEIFGGIIGDSANRRNNFLSEALMSNWDKLITKINEAGASTTEFEESIAKVVGQKKLDSLIKQFGSIEEAVKEGKIPTQQLKKALDELANTKAEDTIADFVAGLKEIDRTLVRGHTGEEIKKVQTALEELGYSVGAPGIDGIFGPLTEGAVKAFQAANNLKEDGIIGPETLAALEQAGTKVNETTKDVNKLKEASNELLDVITKRGGRELLLDSLLNVIEAIRRPLAAVTTAFRNMLHIEPGALYSFLEGLADFTAKLVISKDNAEKLRRTFEGLFAVIDMVTTVLSGGFKIAFDVISAVLEYFNLDILDVTAALGDSMVEFRNWFNKLFDVKPIIKELIPIVQSLIESIKGWFNSLKESEALTNLREHVLGATDGIKEFFETLRGSGNVPGDIIAGLAGGIASGVGAVWGAAVQLAQAVWDAIASFLQIASPSKLMIAAGGFVVAGLVIGISNGTGAVAEAIRGVCEPMLNTLKNAITPVIEFAKNINWKTVFTGLLGIATAINSFRFTGALQAFAAPFEAVAVVIESCVLAIRRVIKGFARVLNGIAFELQTKAIKNLAVSLLILVGAFAILTLLDPNKLTQAYIALGVMIGAIALLALVAKGLAGSSASFKKGEGVRVQGLITGLIAIGAAMLMLAFSVKVMSGMEPGDAIKGFLGILALVGIIALVLKAFSKITDPALAHGAAKVGKMFTKLAVALLILVVVAKLIAGMEWSDMGKAAVGLIGLTTLLAVMIKAISALPRKNIAAVGSTILNIAFALGILVIVAKLIAGMSWGDMGKAAVGLLGLVGIVTLLVLIVKIAKKDIGSIGVTIIALAGAMLALTVAAKIISTMSWNEMGRAAAGLVGLIGVVTLLVLVCKIIDKDVAKITVTLLVLAAAVAMLGGIAVLLGLVPLPMLAKGIGAVALLGGIMTAMIWATRGASNCMGNLIVMTVAIGIMAAALVVLSRIPFDDLKGPIAGLAMLMGVFSLMTLSTKSLQNLGWKSLGAILAMVVVVGALAQVIHKLKDVDPSAAVGNALALSILMVAMSGALAILSVLKMTVTDAAIAIGGLLGMCVPMLAMVDVLKKMSGIDVATDSLNSLIKLAGAMTLLLIPLSIMGGVAAKFKGKGVGAVALGIGALAAMCVPLQGMVAALNKMGDTENAASKVDALCELMTAVTAVLAVVSGLGGLGMIGKGKGFLAIAGGVAALTAMWGPLSAMVNVLKQMGDVEDAASKVDALCKLMTAVTAVLAVVSGLGALGFIGGGWGFVAIVAGIAALSLMWGPLSAMVNVLKQMGDVKNATANVDALVKLITTLAGVLVVVSVVGPLAVVGISAFETLALLVAAIGVVAVAVGALMEEFPQLQDFLNKGLPVLEQIAESMGAMIGKFIGAIGESLMESFVKMAENIAVMMDKLSEASEKASTIDPASFDGVKELLEVIVEIGKTKFKTGEGSDMEKFGESGVAFFETLQKIIDTATEMKVNFEVLTPIIEFADKMIELQTAVDNIGGLDLSDFGENAQDFIEQIKIALESVGDSFEFNETGFDSIMRAAWRLTSLQDYVEPIGGLNTAISGRDDLGKFGQNVADFMVDIMYALESIESGFEFNETAFESILNAAERLIDLQDLVEPIGGLNTLLSGRDDLGKFGQNVCDFIYDMLFAFTALNGTDENGNEIVFNEDMFDTILESAKKLVELQDTLKVIGGIKSWWTGSDDLSIFAQTVSEFALWMMDAFASLNALDANGDAITFNEAMFDSVIAAAKKMAELQGTLEPLGGVISWFEGQKDLGKFGQQASLFGSSMAAFAQSIAETEITEEIVTKIVNAGTALAGLQAALPEDGWLDGKMNLQEFGIDIEEFAYAMEMFGDASTKIDPTAVDTVISVAYRIKGLITALANMDTSGLEVFTGIGSGGFGADGAAYQIGQSMAVYSELVAGINISAVNTSAVAANILTSIISSLAGIDPSGIENFKVSTIASEMAAYSSTLEGFNTEAVSASVSAANSLKAFILGLVGLDTSGIESFKTAINELSTVNVNDFISAFEGVSSDLFSPGASMVDGIIEGVQSKSSSFTSAAADLVSSFATAVDENASTVATAFNTMVSDSVEAVEGKYSSMYSAGTYLVTGFAAGMTDSKWIAESAAAAVAQAAIDSAKATLDINSPSKVFRAIGYSVPEGFAMGIDKMSGMVKTSAIDMAKTAISGVSKSISSIADMVSSDIDAQPTIRPVMDLSDVASGASAINSMLGMGSTIGVSANAGAVSSMMARRSQNGANDDVVYAINKLRDKLDNVGNTYNSIGGITYDDSSNISEAVTAIVRAARMERRV